jgi:hypothetical protein
MVSSGVISNFAYSILNSNIQRSPFPYFITEQVFSEEYYSELMRNMPPDEALAPINESNRLGVDDNKDKMRPSNNRLITYLNQDCVANFPSEIRSIWASFSEFLNGPEFINVMLQKFEPFLIERFSKRVNVNFYTRIQLIRDFTGFAIGPHSDHFKKVAVLLLYLPESADNAASGTSIYVPKKAGFTCEGGPHYESKNFDEVSTAPYLPN